MKLDRCDDALRCYLRNAETQSNFSMLTDLHRSVNELQLHWIVKLNGSENQTEGRPKKFINVELVSTTDCNSRHVYVL